MRGVRIDAALVERDDARAELERLLDIMRDHQHGERVFVPQPGDQPVHILPDARIERAKRFIEQEHARARHQRLRNREALLHPARKLRRIIMPRIGEADMFEHRLSLSLRGAARCAE